MNIKVNAARGYWADDVNSENNAKILQSLMDSLYSDMDGQKVNNVDIRIGDRKDGKIFKTTNGGYRFNIGFFPDDYEKEMNLGVISSPDSRGKFYCELTGSSGGRFNPIDSFYIPMSGSRQKLKDKIIEIAESISGKVESSVRIKKTKISAAYDKTRQKLQDACEGFIGRKADDVLDELDSMGFSDHSSSPVREGGEVVGRREVFWSADYDTDIVIEYDKQTEEVYNAYTEETADNKAGVGASTKTRKTPIKADAADVYENSDDTFEEIFYDVYINDNPDDSYYEREEDAIEVANEYAADPAHADDEITVVLEHYMTNARGEIIDYFEDNGAVVWSSMDAIYDSTNITCAADANGYEDLALALGDAIKKLAADEDHLNNFISYLTQHFPEWLRKYANTPDGLVSEFREFANMNF